MRRIVAPLLLVALLAPLQQVPAVAATPTVVFLAFDAQGTPLSFQDVVSVMTNGGAGWRNDVTYRIADGTLVDREVLFDSGGDAAMHLSEPGVGLSLAWPTRHTGYSTLFIDRGGLGFTSGGTVNLTYRATLDYRAKLDDALARRPEFEPSAGFIRQRQDAEDLIARATAAPDEATRGALGQRALDALAQASETLLRVDGLQRAGSGQEQWWGVTVDSTLRHREVVASIADIVDQDRGRAYARVVFDQGVPPRAYDAIVRDARRDQVVVVGQILDSSAMKRLSLAGWKRRVRAYVGHFPQISVWEIGNEVNGEWLGPAVPEKLRFAARYVKRRDPTDTTMMTLYWQFGTAGTEHSSLFQWIADSVTPELTANVDVVALSSWIGDAPLGIAHDEVFDRLRDAFPDQRLAMGELGYWSPGTTKAWWWRSQRQPVDELRRELARQMYLANLSFDGGIGGVFWWYYRQEMFPRTALWRAVHRTYRVAH